MQCLNWSKMFLTDQACSENWDKKYVNYSQFQKILKSHKNISFSIEFIKQ